MRRDTRPYLSDVIEACEAIEQALIGVDLASYAANRAGALGG